MCPRSDPEGGRHARSGAVAGNFDFAKRDPPFPRGSPLTVAPNRIDGVGRRSYWRVSAWPLDLPIRCNRGRGRRGWTLRSDSRMSDHEESAAGSPGSPIGARIPRLPLR
jgi:hypothetical protein